MRRSHPLDLAAPIALAVITFGALAALTPSRAGARPHPTAPTRPRWQAAPSTWTAPSPRAVAPRTALAPRPAPARPAIETPGAQGVLTDHSPSDRDLPTQDFEDLLGLSGDYDISGASYGSVSYRGRWSRGRYRTVRRAPADRAPGAWSWVGASSRGEPASLCALLPSLCGAGGGAARRPSAASPALVETPAGITLSNADLAIDIARVGACAVRVRRADTGAETLLTFDLPDELVPCEARAVPDVLRDDGVAVRLDAQTPRWSQSVTVSLGDDGPAVSFARATREGAVTTHYLVNASAHPTTFTVDGVDVSAAPGETVTLAGS